MSSGFSYERSEARVKATNSILEISNDIALTPCRYVLFASLATLTDTAKGKLERLSTTRHSLGLYRSVIVTCCYTIARPLEARELDDLLRLALAKIVARHAALCCCVVGEDTENPAVHRLESIDLASVLSFVQLNHFDQLARHLERLHDQTWTNVDQSPLWKVVVFQPTVSGATTVIDIAFVFHHALMDGLSGPAFHKSLLHELQNATSAYTQAGDIPSVIEVPQDIQLIQPLETLVRFSLSWVFLARQVIQEYAPRLLSGSQDTTWAAAPCAPLDERDFKTRIRLVSVPADESQAMLQAARDQNTTLTALINGIIVKALADAVPAAKQFVATTPYTMRKWTGTSTDEMVNQVSVVQTTYDSAFLDEVRAAHEKSIEAIWRVARYFQAEMRAALDKVPQDNVIGLLPYVSSYKDYYMKRLGQPRETTFEVSNLGRQVFETRGEDSGTKQEEWAIENVTFTQGTTVVGPAITISCASIGTGALNLALTWQKGVVEESIVDAVVQALHATAESCSE